MQEATVQERLDEQIRINQVREAELVREIASLQIDKAELTGENTSLKTDKAALEEEVVQLKTDKAALKEEAVQSNTDKVALEKEVVELKKGAVEMSRRYAFPTKTVAKIRSGQDKINDIQNKVSKFIKAKKRDKAAEHQRGANQLIDDVNKDVAACEMAMIEYQSAINKQKKKVNEHNDKRFALNMGELDLEEAVVDSHMGNSV